MSLVSIDKSEDLQKIISTSSNLTVVHFAAPWAAQCSQVSEVLSELSKLSQVKSIGTQFYECNAENVSEVSLKYQVDSVPTIMLFRNGRQLERIDGADASQITAKVKSCCGDAPSTGPYPLPSDSSKSLNDRLRELINRHKVMIFIKGTPEQPRCGFSRTLIQILNETGVTYDSFDILTDEEVRQGLKEFSDWPTYPQVYINGELIGGLDIVKELKASGEFEQMLKADK